MAKRDIERRRQARKELKKQQPKADFLMTEAGQEELIKMCNERTNRVREEITSGGLSVMDYANPQCLSAMPCFDGWIEVEMTAEHGSM